MKIFRIRSESAQSKLQFKSDSPFNGRFGAKQAMVPRPPSITLVTAKQLKQQSHKSIRLG